MKLRVISRTIVQQSVNMAQAIDVVERAYIQLSQGDTVVPLRLQVPVQKQGGVTLFMPAYMMDSDSFGAKIVSVFPGNIQQKLPSIHAIVIVIDSRTGRPEAIMDGTYLTALRTGAASGVATRLLARKTAKVAAILGAGIQGRTQLEAVCAVRPIEKVWVYDIKQEIAEAYVEDLGKQGKRFSAGFFAAQTPAQAVKDADIICAATTSSEPVFEDSDLKPGVHINGIGSYTPEMQEVPSKTVIRSRIFVDSLSASMAEAGDLIIPLKESLISKSHILGEIGQVAAGQLPGRQSEEEPTFFKSVGVAVQDVAVAELILNKARELNLGEEVDL